MSCHATRKVLRLPKSAIIDDPIHLTATEMSAAFFAQTLSPVTVIEALLARIAMLNPKLHAFVDVFGEEALLAAEAADRAIRAGDAIGPLHGVPVALKDLIELEGRVATGGSLTRANKVSRQTATLAKNLLVQGMIVLGKTHTVEFAYGGWGTNKHLGTPWNPWGAEIHHTPGGSSSGSGVAVSARMTPWAVGTDTGGSVRIPSSFCGLTGLKVTRGRISNAGIVPLSPTLDTPGPMARSVTDAAWLFSMMQGEDPADVQTRGIRPVDPFAALTRGVAGLRLGRMPGIEHAGIDPEAAAAYDAALAMLEQLGARIVDVTLPQSLPEYAAASQVLMAEGYAHYGAIAEDPASQIDPAVRRRLLAGAMPARDYLTAFWHRDVLAAEFQVAIVGVDALLTPTTPAPAIPVASADEALTPALLTRFVNQIGFCALALPDGFTAAGLPLSLQIIGRGFDEALVLQIGQAYQNATDWHHRCPPIHGLAG
jgi:aspartyl-tRNA(Asn)/glutamyl-tRNA(Gln) amidotransferase subunit A